MVAVVGRRSGREVVGLGRLLWGRGITALGDGMWFTIWALYFTRVLHLSPATVGAGMAVAGGAGLVTAIPLGALSDRLDARAVLVGLTVVRGVAMACYVLVREPWMFFLVTAAFVAPANGSTAIRTALVAGLVDGTDARVKALARQRVAQHVGYALGAGLGAIVLTAGTDSAYMLAIAGNALTFAVLAVLTATVPGGPGSGVSRGDGRSGVRVVLRDRPYLAVVGATSVLSLCWAMLSAGLPLWIAGSTRLPLSLSGVVVVISSVGIAALQVPVTNLTRGTTRAARVTVWAGVCLAVSCVLLATTAGGSGTAATVVVLLAALFHVAGELGYVGGSWGLSIELMREDARGAYQGASEAATATVQMFAPAVFTLVLTWFAATGWLLVAGVFLACSLPVPALARWAGRTRTAAVGGR
ncbi:MFS transporter [Sphaerisporangium corydalis]|uniref:MFS transporter n=1 Tax=Sphaerisporangium corydalis TaxID=1441875 RepID=A0ABV9EP98_9ACTN|nr:MFS transporter [Sphaerisporangium corydalis]